MIPQGSKFHGVSSFVDTKNRGSATVNKRRDSYTIEDVQNFNTYSAWLTDDGSGGLNAEVVSFNLPIPNLAEITIQRIGPFPGSGGSWRFDFLDSEGEDITGDFTRKLVTTVSTMDEDQAQDGALFFTYVDYSAKVDITNVGLLEDEGEGILNAEQVFLSIRWVG